MKNYQIFKINGELIFEKECNSMKELVEFAVQNEVNLNWANLRGANLRGANLSEANLSGANLNRANLNWANLRGANLSEADLSEADLRGANLRGANLSEADLSEADLRGAKVPLFCKWSLGFVDDLIFVGCERKKAKEWIEWLESDECFETKRNDPDFKRIRAAIIAAIAYQEEMNK